jgi:pantoate--beta-alanine ligase
MEVMQTIADARRLRAGLAGRVALVPTMGALHAGHLSLVEAARKLADHVVVSIYVNPTQFGPSEDFAKYPRPIEADLAACRAARVAAVFHPTDADMYPPAEPELTLDVPALTADLEGACRPGHFRGVCRVVAKLFGVIQPNAACFGRKDYQQLKVIEAMTAGLALPVRIVGLPTVREPDGLALSSRNAYLNADQRKQALGLSKALHAARTLVEDEGETDPQAVERAMHQVLTSHQVAPDYAVVRHRHTLARLDCVEPTLTGGVIALVAGRVGAVRLLDNMLLGGA